MHRAISVLSRKADILSVLTLLKNADGTASASGGQSDHHFAGLSRALLQGALLLATWSAALGRT